METSRGPARRGERASRQVRRRLLVLLAASGAGCGSAPGPALTVVSGDPADTLLTGASTDQRARFRAGDALFGTVFRDADGLGPVFIRERCEACHDGASRGPGLVRKFGLVEDDGVTPAPGTATLGHTERPLLAGGGRTPLLAPDGEAPPGTHLKISTRVGVAVFGRGYLEAVDVSELERLVELQAARGDGVHGRIARVTYHSEESPLSPGLLPGTSGLVGRFGLKARIATLEDFVADALQGDMGLTSPLRPEELPNPDGLADDSRPGVDVSLTAVAQMADYLRLLEIPARAPEAGGVRGRALFDEAGCSACHVPALRTRSDAREPQLAGIDAPVYTDLLLHDLGPSMADGLEDELAGTREWRTAALVGLRFQRTFLHDGRATSIEEAIVQHGAPGSEAEASIQTFERLSAADRQALIAFVESL